MRLSVLDEKPSVRETTDEFSGYCKKLRAAENQWYEQKNMTSDSYPLASVRRRRSIQTKNEANTVSHSSAQSGAAEELNAYGALSAEYLSGDFYVLKRLKNALNEDAGAIFIKNGENLSFESDISEKAAYFGAADSEKQTLRMGTYLCTFPDGVVFESANTAEELPYYKIEKSKTLDNFLISTVYKNQVGEYNNILEYGNDFSVEDGGVFEYLSDKALWTGRETFLKLSALSSENAFEDFSENDCLSIITEGAPGMHGDITGSLVFKNDDYYENTSSYKILEKGSESINGDDRDYIILPGYIIHKVSNKAYLNASDFEIRNNMFPKYQSEEGIKITLRRKIPDIRFACECQNRIWACSENGNEIYASALGNPYNFYDFSGLTTDSYAVNVGSNGEFTACVSFLGRPMLFKEDSLHIISGSYPSNGGELDGLSFAVLTTTSFKGVEKGSEKSLAVIDNILYYKSPCGIVAFDGTNTAIISADLGDTKYKNAVGGARGNKYYVSMQDEAGSWHLFVYDTRLGVWSREDETRALKFINVKSELLYIDAADFSIRSVSDINALNLSDYEREGDFDWECETENIGFSYPDSKYISRIHLRLGFDKNAKASVFIQYDSDGVWHRKGEISESGIRNHLLPIIPVRCDHMKIKLKGSGEVKIISISKLLEEGGDV